MARRFVFEEDGSSKFWEITTSGADVTVRFGRIGTQGQEKTKSHPSAEAAMKDAEKLVAEKTKKGYREEGAAAASSADPAVPAPVEGTPATAKKSPPKKSAEAPASAPSEAPAITMTSAPNAPPTSSAPAAEAEARVIDGHPVRFVAPDWVAALAERPANEKASKKKGLPFAKVWDGVFAGAAALENGNNRYHRWATTEPVADAISQRVRERLRKGEEGDGFDEELEAATLAFVLGGSYICGLTHEAWFALPARVFWHWADRAGGKVAMRTFLRALTYGHLHGEGRMGAPRDFALVVPKESDRAHLNGSRDYMMMREAVRAFGPDELADVLRVHLGFDHATWFLDDHAAADAAVADMVARGESLANAVHVGSLLRDPKHAAAMIAHMSSDEGIVRLVLRHGLDVAEAVFARAPTDTYFPRRWAAPLACFPSLPAARLLVPLLEKKADRKFIGDALAAMPHEAVVALREALGKRPKYRDAIESLMATLLPRIEKTAESGSANVEGEGATSTETAPDSALPRVLVAPPWRAKKRAKEVVVEGLVAKTEVVARAIDLSQAEQEQVAHDLDPRNNYRPEARTAAEVLGLIAANRPPRGPTLTMIPLEDLESLVASGDIERLDFTYWKRESYMPGLLGLLKQHGLRILPMLLMVAKVGLPQLSADLTFVGAVEVAELAVKWVGYKATSRAAYAWARRFPVHAAYGLLPIALGKAGASRDRATQLLLTVDRAGHRDAVVEAARSYGESAAEATRALLERDPLEICPAKAPKMPDGLESLPRVKLRDGRAISGEAQGALLEMLAFSPLDPPYVGVEPVVEACEPASLDALAEALVRTWVAGGMVSAHEWMVRQVALIGTDAAARFLDGRARSWAADGSKQRAMLGLEVLGAMGTDLALSLVGRVSRSSQRQYMKDRALAILAEIAASRGLTADELEDRTAPDLGLDEAGSLTLDFGPRVFHVGFDEHLAPFVRTAEGERLDSFPRANKNDEAPKAKAASEAWKALKAEAEKVSADQISRLERMMGDERRVAPEIFVSAFLNHPLVGHLARRLVWGAYDAAGALVSTFRVAEDRSLATSEDRTYTLATGEGAPHIGVVHPLALDEAQKAEWGGQLSSYEILQPFPQMGREIEPLALAMVPARYSGKKAPSSLLYGLRRHGWRVSADEMGINGYERRIGNTSFYLGFSPSLVTGESAMHDMTVRVYEDDAGGTRPAPSRIQVAEVVRQLDGVVA